MKNPSTNASAHNRLAASTSPYLQQHASNPVDWWPWCPEALDLARRENRPILLSIGYSACHWCHVMAHESFEDPHIAAVMNKLFVNIKVDREERPDLDKIYQTAHQLLTRRAGGWPLTVFLTPDDHVPFFAGTYFPSQSRHGLIAFPDLVQRVAAAYTDQNREIRTQNEAVLGALAQLESGIGDRHDDSPLSDDLLLQADREIAGSFDTVHGGFGNAPKFPHPSSLAYLLQRWRDDDNQSLRDMLLLTLQRIADGGMNDLLGGGFCRYAVDAEWMIPHFEKMLYDNGPLLALYADAWAENDQRPLFAHACARTAEWVMREMQAKHGGYYSSLDADSQGEEGKYYVWDSTEVKGILNDQEYSVFAPRYGLDRPPNFAGRWHLHTFTDTRTLQATTGLNAREIRHLLRSARDKLFARREARIRPARDEKVLTSWNALMVIGMARAGRLLEESDWIASAERAIDFLHDTHWRDGRLLATSKDGNAHLAAYLDDHAYLIEALLELLQARWRSTDLDWAMQLADTLLTHFEDREHGGFFFTANDHERLLLRPKPLADDATPSGNGVAALALAQLGRLVGDTRYIAAAARTLDAAKPALTNAPHAHPTLLLALSDQLTPPTLVVLRTEREELPQWQQAIRSSRHEHVATFAVPSGEADLPGQLGERLAKDGATAYLCRGTHCEAPVSSPQALQALLSDV